MDEAASPPLHRFLSFCRLAMLYHPRAGVQFYDLHLFGRVDLKPGWNAVHSPPGAEPPVRYIFIGAGEGLNSEQKPDVPDSQIHHSYEDSLPPYEGSALHKHLRFMAGVLADRALPGYGAAEVQQIVAAIDAAALEPVGGPTESVGARTKHGLARIKAAISSGAPLASLAAPLRDVIRDALAFRITVTHASNVLSVLLAHLLALPSPLDQTPLIDRLSANVDHLIDRALALKEARNGLKLTPFYEATYLAMLLGGTALLACREAAGQLAPGSKQRRLFERRGLYIDEVSAHDLAPCFMHPADLMPCVPPEYLHAMQTGIADPGGMYPGAAGQGRGPVDVVSMWPKIEAFAAGAAEYEVDGSLSGENNPLSPADVQRLQMFQVTMMLGRGGA